MGTNYGRNNQFSSDNLSSTITIEEVNLLFQSIIEARESEDWEEVVKLSRQALNAPKDVLEEYPLTYAIYECYVHALNSLWRYSEVPNIVKKGLEYEEAIFKPTSKEYYGLRIMEIVALLMMNDWNAASGSLEELNAINRDLGQDIMHEEVASLRDMIYDSMESMDWRKNATSRIDRLFKIVENLLLISKDTEDGYRAWMNFFNVTMRELEQLYFDLNNPEDERYWSRVLACLIVNFATTCDDLHNRECLAYDIAILRKNFLDYHSSLLHKRPQKWEDVRCVLSEGELAIEINMCPNEILILGKTFDKPISVPIQEEITDKLWEYSSSDAVLVNEMYSDDSPLVELIRLISPYLQDVTTIYISPSNIFLQFNYRAIPYKGKLLDDYFEVIQITSTADIGNFKQHNSISDKLQAILIGGVDYDTTPVRIQDNDKDDEFVKMIANLRSGYGYLPFSLVEVEEIASVMGEQNCIVLTGNNADKCSFMNLDGTTVPVIHIATHGYSIPSQNVIEPSADLSKIATVMSRTGFLLAGANRALKDNSSAAILTSGEIAKLDLSNVKLAVLSFCSSGLGDLTNTTGVVYGVANAMKTSGVQEILVTLWDVPDEVASIAMTEFYKNFSMGMSSNDSLKLAQKSLKNQGYTDPYYWASFMILD